MKVSEAMSRDVLVANPDETIQQAAQLMCDLDIGSLPVGENDRLIGMITDRDIAIRAVGEGRDCETKIRDVMTDEVKYCFDDQDIEEITRNMADEQIRRLPVVDRSKRLVGVLSLGDIAKTDRQKAGKALSGISREGGQHSQGVH
jgi:CBS domain-containing protein